MPMKTTDTEQPEPIQQEAKADMTGAMASAFQFGYLCAEKGMNLEAAMQKFYDAMNGKLPS